MSAGYVGAAGDTSDAAKTMEKLNTVVKELPDLVPGDRVRIQGGKNFDKFHGGMEGYILENNVEGKNMEVDFTECAPTPDKILKVAYRHLEHAPQKGGYRAGNVQAQGGTPQAQAPAEPEGPQADEHGDFQKGQVVRINGLEKAPELNGKVGRLKTFDINAGRWNIDVRETGNKRLKPDNVFKLEKVKIDPSWSVEECKAKGNEGFKSRCLEDAICYYTAALDLCEENEELPEAKDTKYKSVVYGNRAQCYINLAREVQGEDKSIRKEARMLAMRANMDSATAIELDPTNGKALYRRGCAMLGMAPSASRAKEAIEHIEKALTGRASGNQQDGIVLPNAMRLECQSLLEYAKRRLDACTEAAIPDVEVCRENCRQQ